MIKGGVWKNTEDEILKAAVMKYGKNQWSRVASLLSRKSAKQCKARWYEWLDPSIKKTEWSRDEEEKLLHLSKLMPSQWRTIAPIVGRTAAQCMEHYEKLLDAAQEQQGLDVAEDDPRRLRPGEIDPNPENKPARPDPVDMDEDEKEMLSEARARLMNTQGKKAKRKAREKQLEEARRLANLQKRRELKAAGLCTGKRHLNLKRRNMDYATEIPFEKRAPAGFYDTLDETKRETKMSSSTAMAQMSKMEGRRRDEEEKKARKHDAKRQKRLAKSQLPQQMLAINALNDPSQRLIRKPLALPEPQVSAAEFEHIAKFGRTQQALLEAANDEDELDEASSSSSRGLLGNYTAPSNLLSTPQFQSGSRGDSTTAMGGDIVMQEAANLAALARAETPLLGGDNIELHEGTGYAGITPKRMESSLRTPLVLLGNNDAVVGSSPASLVAPSPMRDELNINHQGEENHNNQLAVFHRNNEKRQAKLSLMQLESDLKNLPSAQNSYEISLPDSAIDTVDEKDTDEIEEDAADRDGRRAKQLEARKEAEFRRRSTVLQREDLPRPFGSLASAFLSSSPVSTSSQNHDDEIEHLIRQEMKLMLSNDEIKYPNVQPKVSKKKSSKKKTKSSNSDVPVLDALSDEILQQAKNMIRMEGNVSSSNLPIIDYVKHADVWEECWKECQADSNLKTKQQRVDALKGTFYSLEMQLNEDRKRSDKLNQRIQILTGGLRKRAHGLTQEIQELDAQISARHIENSSFQLLSELESQALPQRLYAIAAEVETQKVREAELQERYAELMERKKDLLA